MRYCSAASASAFRITWFDSCCSTNLAFTAEAESANTERLENFMMWFSTNIEDMYDMRKDVWWLLMDGWWASFDKGAVIGRLGLVAVSSAAHALAAGASYMTCAWLASPTSLERIATSIRALAGTKPNYDLKSPCYQIKIKDRWVNQKSICNTVCLLTDIFNFSRETPIRVSAISTILPTPEVVHHPHTLLGTSSYFSFAGVGLLSCSRLIHISVTSRSCV